MAKTFYIFMPNGYEDVKWKKENSTIKGGSHTVRLLMKSIKTSKKILNQNKKNMLLAKNEHFN